MGGVTIVSYACSLAHTFKLAFDAGQLFHTGHGLRDVAIIVSTILCGIKIRLQARVVISFQERLQAGIHKYFAPTGNTTQRVADSILAYCLVRCFQYATILCV